MAAGYLLPLLDPFQVALLAGGAERATDTAIVSLADCGLLRAEVISAQFGGRFFAGGTPAAGAHPIELTVHATAARPNAPWFFESIHDWNVRLLQARDQAGKLKERQRMRARTMKEDGPAMRQVPGASHANLCHAVRQPAADVRRELQQLGLVRPSWPTTRRTPVGRDALAELRRCHRALKDGAGAYPSCSAGSGRARPG